VVPGLWWDYDAATSRIGTGADAGAGEAAMDQTYLLFAMIGFAVIGILAVLVIARRNRQGAQVVEHETPFAVSTEGMKRCPNCGTGNLVTDSTCSNCGKRLPG
jgi:hypothetical protein